MTTTSMSVAARLNLKKMRMMMMMFHSRGQLWCCASASSMVSSCRQRSL